MKTLQEIVELADVKSLLKQNPGTEPRGWIRLAKSLFEKGDQHFIQKEFDEAYLKYLIAVQIIMEVIPKHKLFDSRDFQYQTIRSKLEQYVQKMEGLKKMIQESDQQKNQLPSPPLESIKSTQNDIYTQFRQQLEKKSFIEQRIPNLNSSSQLPIHSRSNTGAKPVYFEKITCPELHERLFKTAPHVLFLDIRPVEEFIQGHISWKSTLFDGIKLVGGVVNIEPDWLKENVTVEEIENCLGSFGSNVSKKLFQARNDMDVIVFYDSNTRQSSDSINFEHLFNAMYTKQVTNAPRPVPKYLAGGFQAWSYFVKSTANIAFRDWIEIGQGIGISGFGDHLKNNIGSVAARMEQLNVHVNSTNHSRSNSVQKPLLPGKQIVQDPESDKENSPALPKKEYVTKTGIRIPTRQSSMKNLKERQDTFDDPFFTFSRSSIPTSPTTDASTTGNVLYPITAPKEAPRTQGLSKPLIALPQASFSIDLEDASKRFPEISLSEPQAVQYPTSHSRVPSPAPFSASVGYDKNIKEQGDFHSRYPTVESMNLPPPRPVVPKPDMSSTNYPSNTYTAIQKPVHAPASFGNSPNAVPGPGVNSNSGYPSNYGLPKPVYQPSNVALEPPKPLSNTQYRPTTSPIPGNPLLSSRPTSSSSSPNPAGQPPALLPKPSQQIPVGQHSVQPPALMPKPIQQNSAIQPPALLPKPSTSTNQHQYTHPGLQQQPVVPPKPMSNYPAKDPPPLLPKPNQLSHHPPLPAKPKIDVSHPVLIRGQNPMLLPTSPIHSSFGLSGLRNLGNTCFMNSTIQCLSATIPLARYFLGGTYRRHIARSNPLSSNGRVADTYAKLIQSMWSRDETVVVPSEFKSVMGDLHPSFAGNEQQDSQEFLSFLLDQLHEDLNIAKRPFPAQGPDIDSEDYPEARLMELEWKRYSARNWSIIVDMFQGTLKSRLQCLTCGKTSTTFNPFMYLTLPIPSKSKKDGAVSIQECLEEFLEEEKLSGDDAWNCPRCKKPRSASKRLSIVKLPTVLLVHLKRFSFEGPFRNKLETRVRFPLTDFDLTRYVQFFDHIEPYVYNLYAVSNHYGGLNGGHYTAQVYHNHNNSWYNLDDSRVSQSKENDVQSNAAYILFYVKSGRHDMKDWWKGNPEL